MAQESRSSKFLASSKPLAIMATAGLIALGGLLVDRYGAKVLDVVDNPEAVSVHAEYDAGFTVCGFTARLPDGFDLEAHPLPEIEIGGGDEVVDWLVEQEAAFLYTNDVMLRVEGRRSSPVEITSLRAEILDRQPVPSGPEISVLCEGEVGVIPVGIDLSEPGALARTILSDGYSWPPELGEPYFSQTFVSLEQDEVAQFGIRAFTTEQAVTWQPVLEVLDSGSEKIEQRAETVFITAGEGGSQPAEKWYGVAWYEDGPEWVTPEQICEANPDPAECLESWE